MKHHVLEIEFSFNTATNAQTRIVAEITEKTKPKTKKKGRKTDNNKNPMTRTSNKNNHLKTPERLVNIRKTPHHKKILIIKFFPGLFSPKAKLKTK